MNPAVLISLDKIVVIKVLILMVILVFLFLSFGTAGAGIPDATIGKVLLAAVLTVCIQWSVAVVLSLIPAVGGILGFIFSILAMIYILKLTFVTAWGRVGIAFALAVVAEIAAATIADLYLGINALEFIQKLFFVT